MLPVVKKEHNHFSKAYDIADVILFVCRLL